MRIRVFNVAAACSLIIVGALVLLSFAPTSDPRKQHLNVCGWFYMEINGEGPNAIFYIFNDLNAGPLYFGLYPIIAGEPKSNEIHAPGFGYWHLRWRDGTSLWTIKLNVLYPLNAALVLPVLWLIPSAQKWKRLPDRWPTRSGIARTSLATSHEIWHIYHNGR